MTRPRVLTFALGLALLGAACRGGGAEVTSATTAATTISEQTTTSVTTTTGEQTTTTVAEATAAPTGNSAILAVDVSPATDRDFADLGYEPLVWSPDGSNVFASGEGEVCVLSTFGTDDQCFAWVGDVATPSWSADSNRVVFTENSYALRQESDIWVLDVGEGSLADWTDDGYSYDELYRGARLDFFPVWVGDEVAFVRFVGSDSWSLERIAGPVGSGETSVTCSLPTPVAGLGPTVAAGNAAAGVTVVYQQEASFEVCRPDGLSSSVALEPDATRGEPLVVGVLPDGRMILYYQQYAGRGSTSASQRSAMDIVSVDGAGSVEILAPDDDPGTSRIGPSLFLVDESETAAAVVMGVGTPEGFSDTPLTGLILPYDLTRPQSIDPLAAQPLWAQAGDLFPHSLAVARFRGGVYQALGPGDGAVVLMVNGVEDKYYRITLETVGD